MGNGQGIALTGRISIEELKALDATGISRAEMAGQLETTEATLRKYLGPRTGKRISRHAYATEPRKAEEPQFAARLSVQNKSIELHGRFGAYLVDCKDKKVLVTLPKSETDEDVFDLEFEKLDDLIGELQAIQRKIQGLTAGLGSEMW